MEPVYLRALDIDDLDTIYRWHNNRELQMQMGGAFRYLSHAAEEARLRERLAYSSTDVALAICLEGSSQHIGNIGVSEIDWIARHGEVTMLIGESLEQAEAYGQAALRLLTDHAVEEMGLRRLYAFVLAEDAFSMGIYEACGWTVEATLREHAFADGEFKDVVVMGICMDGGTPEDH